MMSNVAGAFRAILAKKAMGKPQGENMGDANLYAVLTIMSSYFSFAVEIRGRWVGRRNHHHQNKRFHPLNVGR